MHPNIYINGEWKTGAGSIFSSSNPATGDVLWQGREATLEDVDDVVHNGIQAFKEWSSLSLQDRFSYLSDFASLLLDAKRSVAIAISQETGKPLWDAQNEVDSVINKVSLTFEAYRQRCAELTKKTSSGQFITRHHPHGIVAVLGPYNFPGHLPHGHIIPALLAGNTVVFKPSEKTPLVAEVLMNCWHQIHLPKGVLNLVQGGRETGQALAGHPHIDGLLFTGNYQTGQFLSELFNPNPSKILVLELGGNNPLVIGEVSDIEAAAHLTVQSAYLSSGQRCTCARRLILPNSFKNNGFIDLLTKKIKALKIGAYTESPVPFMGPIISEDQAKKLIYSQKELLSKGGEALIMMRHLKQGTGFLSPGLMDVTSIQNRPDEEIFGPFLQVIYVDQFEDAIKEANRTKFGLSAGLLSDNPQEYEYFRKYVKAGIINWNSALTGASSAMPFGGIKCSGNHRPSAYYAVDYCSYPVASHEVENQIGQDLCRPA